MSALQELVERAARHRRPGLRDEDDIGLLIGFLNAVHEEGLILYSDELEQIDERWYCVEGCPGYEGCGPHTHACQPEAIFRRVPGAP